jgi:energy-coupling factor transport system ATP-binding protein
LAAAIKTENLSHVYSAGTVFEKPAIQNINIEIEKGEFVGIIGHTGSGKSTLIQHFNGLLKPTSGKVYVDGEDIWLRPRELRRFRFKVGLVFQYPEYQLFEETCHKDIAFGPKNMGLSPGEVNDRVLRAARAVGLDAETLNKSPFELSGGLKRRVAIAGVMAMEPEVLILDEPTAGLDPRGRDRILSEISAFHRERGSTVLLISHSMEDIARHAKKVLVMNESAVFCYGDVKTVFAKAAELKKMGLAVPQVTSVFIRLKKMGYPVPADVYTVEEARRVLLRLLGKDGDAPC